MDQIKLRQAMNLPLDSQYFSSSGFQSEIQVEPMCERRVRPAAPAGVFAIIRMLRRKKKAAGGPPHECDGQSAALLDAQALRWTRL